MCIRDRPWPVPLEIQSPRTTTGTRTHRPLPSTAPNPAPEYTLNTAHTAAAPPFSPPPSLPVLPPPAPSGRASTAATIRTHPAADPHSSAAQSCPRITQTAAPIRSAPAPCSPCLLYTSDA